MLTLCCLTTCRPLLHQLLVVSYALAQGLPWVHTIR
jgi:hypothetical protein